MKYTLAVAALIATAAAEDAPKKEAPKCELKTFKLYTDKGCTKEDTATAAADQKTIKTALTAGLGCKDDGKVKVTCDGTGITTQTYKEAKCAGDADGDATVLKWGACTETAKDSGKWVKVTGAKALMASATIALAFVGSQF
tara:strand:+ start:179 stop:601 length:423 start_codon:yes stop_codon:yes gene_type:complete